MRLATLFMSVVIVILLSFRAWPGGIGWEAEDFAVIKPPMQVYEDNKEASGGKYVASPTADQGSVEYKVEVPKAGDYFLWVFWRFTKVSDLSERSEHKENYTVRTQSPPEVGSRK